METIDVIRQLDELGYINYYDDPTPYLKEKYLCYSYDYDKDYRGVYFHLNSNIWKFRYNSMTKKVECWMVNTSTFDSIPDQSLPIADIILLYGS